MKGVEIEVIEQRDVFELVHLTYCAICCWMQETQLQQEERMVISAGLLAKVLFPQMSMCPYLHSVFWVDL